ncbi:MAG: rubredoxin [Planctomycetota bacterium]|jgi:rubredoxin
MDGGRLMSYWCRFCQYVYEPELGDEAAGIPPGTAFEDLPDGWVCPVCGAPKNEFRPTDYGKHEGK